MKKAIYMITTVILNVVAIIVFRDHIIISELSSLSAIFMLLMGFFSWEFKLVKNGEMPMNVGSGTADLNDDEIAILGGVLQSVSLGIIPLFIPFVFFFNDKIKALVPSIILCSFVVVGILFFRFAYGKKIKARLDAQEKERQETEKRERGEL